MSIRLVVARGVLQIGQGGNHRVPARPAVVGVVLGFGGGHVVKGIEGMQDAHPAQHVVVALVRLPGVAANVVDQLLVGFVAVLGAGGSGSKPDCRGGEYEDE